MHIINQVIYISRICYFKKKESCFCDIENTYAGFHTVKKNRCFLFGEKKNLARGNAPTEKKIEIGSDSVYMCEER